MDLRGELGAPMGAEVATLCLHEAADRGALRPAVRERQPLVAAMTRERAEMILALEAETARQCADMAALHGALVAQLDADLARQRCEAVRAGEARRADSLLAFERSDAQLAAVQRDLRSEVVALGAAMRAALGETQEHQARELKHLAGELERRTATLRANESEHAANGEQPLAGAAERMRNEMAALLSAEVAKQADAVRARLDEAEQRVAQLAADSTTLRARVDALEGANARLHGEVAKLRSKAVEFRGAADGRLSGLDAEMEAPRRAVSAMQLYDCEGLALRAWGCRHAVSMVLSLSGRRSAVARRRRGRRGVVEAARFSMQ